MILSNEFDVELVCLFLHFNFFNEPYSSNRRTTRRPFYPGQPGNLQGEVTIIIVYVQEVLTHFNLS